MLRDVHLEVTLRNLLREFVRVGRIAHLAVERDDAAVGLADCDKCIAVCLASRHFIADVVARQFERSRFPLLRVERIRFAHLDDDVPFAAELGDRFLRIVERLAVPAFLVLDRLHPLALDRARDDGGWTAGRCERFLVGAVDRVDVVSVDFDRRPAVRFRAPHVGGEIPTVHRLASLAEPVDVEDRDEVVE